MPDVPPTPSTGTDRLRSKPASSGARPATIYDVARLAGVSHQTVSRLVKGFSGIRPQTRERVEAAIVTLNYQPNLVARSLATSRPHRIAALTHELLEVGPSKTVQGASLGAREAGYLLDIVSLDLHDKAAIDTAVRMLNQRDLAGVIAFAASDGLIEVFSHTEFSIPSIIDTEHEDRLGGETSLNGLGEIALVDHLVELGHVGFFHISGPMGWLAARNRELAYRRRLADHGLHSLGTENGDWSARSGYECANRMPLDRGITALVVANDQMALGAMRALNERKIRVPVDISVVGFDDMPDAAYFQPPLTTVRLEYDQHGRMAVQRMIALIEGVEPVRPLVAEQPQLALRASSAPPRQL